MATILTEIATILHNDFRCERMSFEEKEVGMKIDVDCDGCQCLVYKYDKQLDRQYKGGLFPFCQKRRSLQSQ